MNDHLAQFGDLLFAMNQIHNHTNCHVRRSSNTAVIQILPWFVSKNVSIGGISVKYHDNGSKAIFNDLSVY